LVDRYSGRVCGVPNVVGECRVNKRFPWGKVVEIIECGPYTIKVYHPNETDCRDQVIRGEYKQVLFYHGHINGVDCNESWHSIDEALAGLIVRNALGDNFRHINEHFIAGLVAMSEGTS
jgi:hypothetical protein